MNTHRSMVRILTCLAMVCIALTAEEVAAQACGSLKNGYGPFDYRTQKDKLVIVEEYHFQPQVEFLKSGVSSSIGDDIDYTLRASPNHHRALRSMVRLGRKQQKEKPEGSRYTVQCWLVRAVEFAPDDAHVRVLYGHWLIEKGDKRAAAQQIDAAKSLYEQKDAAKTDANLAYNLGLGMFELGRFDEAVQLSKTAKELGFPLDGLEKKLRRSGKWRE